MREYVIDDDGDCLQFHLIQDGQQVGGGLIDLEPLGPDAALEAAMVVCLAFVQTGGVWGGARPI